MGFCEALPLVCAEVGFEEGWLFGFGGAAQFVRFFGACESAVYNLPGTARVDRPPSPIHQREGGPCILDDGDSAIALHRNLDSADVEFFPVVASPFSKFETSFLQFAS